VGVRLHGSEGLTETKMVANANRAGSFRFGHTIAKKWLVQTSMGHGSKDSSNEGANALKPLAQISVYIVAEAKTR
jgi:hypothetical protein